MNILSLTAHSIEEHDMIALLSGMGHAVFSPGAYIDPEHPHDDMRPPIPRTELTWHPDLKAIVEAVGTTAERPDVLWNAKDNLPDALIDWADVIMCHHVEWRWLWPQWDRIKHKRVIWRTVGQSTHQNEWNAQPYVNQGLEVIRYSPKERNIPNYAGESALIRFYKDPTEWNGWTGEKRHILMLAQNPTQRGDDGSWVNLAWALNATKDLPVRWVGPGTEPLGGPGKVSPEELKQEMRDARCAIYTGTQPASYTLAIIEMMMTGTPVVSIGPDWMRLFPYSHRLFEGHCIAPLWADSPLEARELLVELLDDGYHASIVSEVGRHRAKMLFGKERIEKDWAGWLDSRTPPSKDPSDLPDVATWGMTEEEIMKEAE